jgi:threonine dehydrogenase-like Zn-dependent dehydrogenase
MPAVYGGIVDRFPHGAFMQKGLTLKTGQTHVQHYLPGLLNAIMEGKIDTTFLISHRLRSNRRRLATRYFTTSRMK